MVSDQIQAKLPFQNSILFWNCEPTKETLTHRPTQNVRILITRPRDVNFQQKKGREITETRIRSPVAIGKIKLPQLEIIIIEKIFTVSFS